MPIRTIIEPFRIKSVEPIWRNRTQIHGLRLTFELPFLRHFTAKLEQL